MDQPAAAAISTAEALRAELAPVGTFQRFLVDLMGRAMDRTARLDDAADPNNPASLRLQTQAERSFYRALTEFRRQVRAPLKGEKAAPRAEAPPAAVVAPGAPGAPRAMEVRDKHARPSMAGPDVEFDAIIGLMEQGWSDDEILARHPRFDLGDPVDHPSIGGASTPARSGG